MSVLVKAINKQGNKIVDYDCIKDGVPVKLDRDSLIDLINNKEVENARIQIYKDQIIIRVNLDKANEDNQNKEEAESKREKTVRQTRKSSKVESVTDIMKKIASGYRVRYFDQYSEIFFKNNTDLVGKEYTDEQVEEKIKVIREINRFWMLVAKKQADLTFEHYNKALDDMEFAQYCKDNNLNYTEE